LTPIAMFFDTAVSLAFEREWVTGWVRTRPFAWHVPSRRMIRPEGNRHGDEHGFFVGGDGALAVVDSDVATSTIRIYRGVLASTATR